MCQVSPPVEAVDGRGVLADPPEVGVVQADDSAMRTLFTARWAASRTAWTGWRCTTSFHRGQARALPRPGSPPRETAPSGGRVSHWR